MKHRLSIIIILASYATIVCGQIVLPSPNQVEIKKGKLTLQKDISICTTDTAAFYVSLFRSEVLHNAPIRWQPKASDAHICWMNDPSLPPEGYKITINPRQMTVSASNERGFIYAIQTLRQWVTGSTGKLTFICADITDSPRMQWRCFLLDSGRQYQKYLPSKSI